MVSISACTSRLLHSRVRSGRTASRITQYLSRTARRPGRVAAHPGGRAAWSSPGRVSRRAQDTGWPGRWRSTWQGSRSTLESPQRAVGLPKSSLEYEGKSQKHPDRVQRAVNPNAQVDIPLSGDDVYQRQQGDDTGDIPPW